ncbi:hypothetical protein HDU81_006206 [Chytriomyces hyalinus]|nr:hypothetical protein HDU81_006206 [Chytriomyces hyalinus]
MLPIEEHQGSIRSAIDGNRVLVLSAETGAGKSTWVPVLLAGMGSAPRVIVAQPRRVAAVRLAERVSSTNPNIRVGYRIMHDTATDPNERPAQVLFATVGYLVHWLANNDSLLGRATFLVLDEAHERSVDMDLLAMLIARRMEKDSFKLVVMSATLDTPIWAEYFKKLNLDRPVPCIQVGVKRFPVAKLFLNHLPSDPLLAQMFAQYSGTNARIRAKQDALKKFASMESEHNDLGNGNVPDLTLAVDFKSHLFSRMNQFKASCRNGAQKMMPSIPDEDYNLAVEIALHISKLKTDEETLGECVLVFLPGENEIMTWIETLDRHLAQLPPHQRARVQTHVLHSQTPRDQLDLAFIPALPNNLKIVLSTNIAESSVTISDVSTVIDHGLRRSLEFNASMGCQSLKLGWVSRASSTQRAGRSGRCRPGLYIALFTEDYYNKVLADHDPPEIQTLSLDQTVLKVKSLFPSERVKFLLDSLIEPPSTTQLALAFQKLVSTGALTRPAVNKNLPSKLNDFDESGSTITFLGSTCSRFPCDISITRLLLLGASCDLALESCVVAAALAGSDVFSMPTSFFSHDRAELCVQMAASFGGRVDADAGLYSEPLSVLQVFKGWLSMGGTVDGPDEGRGHRGERKRDRWLVERGVHLGRWKQFRASVAAFAGRLKNVIQTQNHASRFGGVSSGDNGAAVDVLSRLEALKNVAADALRSRGDPSADLALAGQQLVEYLFPGSLENVRAVILAGCSQEIYHGTPMAAATKTFNAAGTKLGQLGREGKQTGKVAKKNLEAELTAQMFSFGSQSSNGRNTMADVTLTRSHMLNLFCKYVPKAPATSHVIATSKEYSYCIVLFPGAISTHPPFDVSRTAIISLNKFSPPEATNANSLREMFSWMGCTRVLCLKSESVLEFMDDAILRESGKMDAISSLMNQFGAVAIHAGPVQQVSPAENPSLSGQTTPFGDGSANFDSNNVKSVFATEPKTTQQKRVSNDGDNLRVVEETTTVETTRDLCMSLRFLATLTSGRKHLWMPHPDAQTAGSKEEGVELGKVQAAFQMSFAKGGSAGTSEAAVFKKLPVRPSWRAPFYGSVPVHLYERTHVVEKFKTTKKKKKNSDGGWELVKRVESQKQSYSAGHAIFIAAGSSQLVETAKSSFLGLSGITAIPSNEVSWNLKMLMLNPKGSELLLSSSSKAIAVFHYHHKMPDDEDSIESWIRTHSFLGNGHLEAEDLALINQARYDFGRLFYDGTGLSTGKLAESYLANSKMLSGIIMSRGESGPSPSASYIETHWREIGVEPHAPRIPESRPGVPAVIFGADSRGRRLDTNLATVGSGLDDNVAHAAVPVAVSVAFTFSRQDPAIVAAKVIMPPSVSEVKKAGEYLDALVWPEWKSLVSSDDEDERDGSDDFESEEEYSDEIDNTGEDDEDEDTDSDSDSAPSEVDFRTMRRKY